MALTTLTVMIVLRGLQHLPWPCHLPCHLHAGRGWPLPSSPRTCMPHDPMEGLSRHCCFGCRGCAFMQAALHQHRTFLANEAASCSLLSTGAAPMQKGRSEGRSVHDNSWATDKCLLRPPATLARVCKLTVELQAGCWHSSASQNVAQCVICPPAYHAVFLSAMQRAAADP